jgi:peptidyl-prolyl cis-trans isomerase D
MLQSIRDNSQSIVAKVIVGLIIVTFALFGVESLVSLGSGAKAPATVNGEDITEQDLYQATELQRRQLLSQMGENADPALLDENLIRTMVLDGLIEQKALLLAAKEQSMLISDQMIDQMIVATPDFQVDGKFNRDQFEAVLRNAGFTPMMYRELLRKERTIEQVRNAYQLSAFTAPSEMKRIIDLDRQTRDLSYVVYSLDNAKSQVEITDEEVKAQYEADRNALMTEEQVSLQYLLLDKNDLRKDVSVTDAEIQAQYDQYLAGFRADEQRQVAHILVEVNDQQDDVAALAKVKEIKARIDAGADFAEEAKAQSDDVGSAQQGGDLGVNAKGVFSAPFEEAMFSLALNGVSEPVRTEFGYHLVKVLGISQQEAASFEMMKAQLTEDLIDQKIEAVYVERLEQLADTTFSAGDLIEPSSTMQLPIQESQPFNRAGGELDITRNAKVIAAAFSNELLKEGLNSTPIELDKERSVVVRVKQHFEPRELALEEVADTIKDRLTTEKASALLETKAKEAVAQIKSGSALADVAAGLEVKTVTAATRNANNVEFDVLQKAFSMPKPAENMNTVDYTQTSDSGVAVVIVSKVVTPDTTLSAEELKGMSSFMSNRLGQQDYQGVVSQIKATAEVEKL